MNAFNLRQRFISWAQKRSAAPPFRSEQGAALVEFALCLPIMAFVFVGIVDYALMLQEQMTICKAAAAGAAFGAIYGNQTNFTGMQAAAASAAPGVTGFTSTASAVWECSPGGASVSATSSCAGYGTPIKYIKVVAQGTTPNLIGVSFLGLTTTETLQSTVYFRVRWTSS